jgi:hypothetical protein
MVTVAEGVFLHLDDARRLVAVEVIHLSGRWFGHTDEPALARLHVNKASASFYFDVSAGTRIAVDAAPVADGVYLHADGDGALVAVEVLDVDQRGGLHVQDLDAEPGSERPALFDEIERAWSGRGPRRHPA